MKSIGEIVRNRWDLAYVRLIYYHIKDMLLESDLISYKQPLIIYYTFLRGATKCRGRISEKRPYIFSFHLVLCIRHTAWKVSKCGFFSDLNTGKHGPEKTPYWDIFHAVADITWNVTLKVEIKTILFKIISRNWPNLGKIFIVDTSYYQELRGLFPWQ